MDIIEFVSQPWHWSISGIMIVIVMVLLILNGQRFGISSSFDTFCTISGAGKKISYFNTNWKEKDWLIVFILGSIIGGYIGGQWFTSPSPVIVSDATIADLAVLGIQTPSDFNEGAGFVPRELFGFSNLSGRHLLILIFGGFSIGFGTRYAGGCTSGHAISGLSNFQLPSLIAVIGFFIGGLITTYFLLPMIF